MSKWDYVSKRRRLILEKFVEAASTLEEALEIFHRKRMTPPNDGSLESLFGGEAKTVVSTKILPESKPEETATEKAAADKAAAEKAVFTAKAAEAAEAAEAAVEAAAPVENKEVNDSDTEKSGQILEDLESKDEKKTSKAKTTKKSTKPKKNKWGIVEKSKVEKK